MNIHLPVVGSAVIGAVLVAACGSPSDATGSATSAATTSSDLNIPAAVAFANVQWDCEYTPACTETVSEGSSQSYECAEFVSRSIAAGGAVPGFNAYTSSAEYTYPANGKTYDLAWVSSQGTGCGVTPRLGLQDYLDATGEWDNWSTNPQDGIQAGDVLFVWGQDNCGKPNYYGHVVFGVGPGVIDAHNLARYQDPASDYANVLIAVYRIKPTTPPPPPPPAPAEVGQARAGATLGWWDVSNYGKITAHGGAVSYGDASTLHLDKLIVGMASVPDGKGYWLVAADGGVFTYGDAHFYGSEGGKALNAPIVGIAPTPDGLGYWLVASDGGVFTFGDAKFYGSMGGKTLAKPVVGIAGTQDGLGYWLVASDGGIFSFGDAKFLGSMGGKTLNKPIVGAAVTYDGGGYWLVASDGGIFNFGDAKFQGSLGGETLSSPIVGIIASPTSDGGYLLDAANGAGYPFGSF